MTTPLFVDSFLYNGDDIVRLRLAYLYNYVDLFYITESIYSFSGEKKSEFMIDKNMHLFQPYLSKIRFLKVHEKLTNIPFQPSGNEQMDLHIKTKIAFIEEKAQRNYVRQHLLRDLENKDYILCLCDCDEIYDLRTIGSDKKALFNEIDGKHLLLRMKRYNYNYIFFHSDDWEMAYCITSNVVKEFEDLDHLRTHKLGNRTFRRVGGWHFAYFMTKEEILRKIQCFSHVDLNVPAYTNLNVIGELIKNGSDVFGNNEKPVKFYAFEDEFNNYPSEFKPYFLDLIKKQGLIS
jgi:hypothetical protein